MKKEKIQNIPAVSAQQERVVVKIGTQWCGPCKTLNPKLEELEKQFTDIQFLDVTLSEVDDQIYFTKTYDIREVPFTMFFSNGIRVFSFKGDKSINEIQSEIEKWMV
ncbi:MAG: thioredoxin family protein [Bacteroidetes bacterium]|nr:thioredoxin family protein [Bacteroidota bacterium]